MRAWLQRAALAAVVILSAAAGFGVAQQNTPKAGAAQPDAPARLAALTLPDSQNKPQPLAQWRGKVWVVNFWATWCAPCREEMPMLGTLSREYAQHKNGPVQFLGIGIDTPEAMRDFARQVPVPYPLLAGDNEVIALSAELGNTVMALPFTVVIDAQGRVRGKHLGKLSEAQLRALIGY